MIQISVQTSYHYYLGPGQVGLHLDIVATGGDGEDSRRVVGVVGGEEMFKTIMGNCVTCYVITTLAGPDLVVLMFRVNIYHLISDSGVEWSPVE